MGYNRRFFKIQNMGLSMKEQINELLDNEESEEKEDKYELSDIFQVVTFGSTVHTKGSILNTDFTLSDLNENERFFIREQLKLIELMVKYVQHKQESQKLKKVMTIDIHAVLVLSRARHGRIIKAILRMIMGRSAEEEDNMAVPEGFFSRMFRRHKTGG